ncbi:MAG: hypothetical protein R3D00_28595 [Bacteroidia bacterium]
MKNVLFKIAFALFVVAAYSCNTSTKAQNHTKFNYNDLYKVWVVDTILVLNTKDVSTPDIEMDQNEYRFTKEGTNLNQGTRTSITSGASFDVAYTIVKGTINFGPEMTFPISKFDENGNLISINTYGVSLPPYKIIELSPTNLTLQNKDIMMKLKAK